MKIIFLIMVVLFSIFPVWANDYIQRNPYEICQYIDLKQVQMQCSRKIDLDYSSSKKQQEIEKEAIWTKIWTALPSIGHFLVGLAQVVIAAIAFWAIILNRRQTKETLEHAMSGLAEVVEKGITKFLEDAEILLHKHGIIGQTPEPPRENEPIEILLLPYEFTIGANAQASHSKSLRISPEDPFKKRIEVANHIVLTSIQSFETKLTDYDKRQMSKIYKVLKDSLYQLWGIWNASGLPEELFNEKELESPRPQYKLALKFWIPFINMEELQGEKIIGIINTPTNEMIKWIHDRIRESEKPGGRHGQFEPIIMPFYGETDRKTISDVNDFIQFDEKENDWKLMS